MNQSQREHLAADNPTQNDIIHGMLTARPCVWISLPALTRASRSAAVHSRIAQIRKKRGIRIDQCSIRVPSETGRPVCHSYYCYVPPGTAPPPKPHLTDNHTSPLEFPHHD